VLENISSEIYCVNKIMDIDKFLDTEEIHIFCYNIKSFSKRILIVLNNFTEYGIEVRINFVNKIHWCIEILKDNKTEIIFHLYCSFKKYKNINIEQGLFTCILSGRIKKKIYVNEVLTKIYFINNADNLIIKYLDYFDSNYPILDNDIHLNFIVKKLENKSDGKIFLDRVNRYISYTKDSPQNKIHKLIFFFKKKIKLIFERLARDKKDIQKNKPQ
jgi:hypothetical protein